MTKQIFSTKQWLMAGAVLFLSAACQPKEAAPSNPSKPSSVDSSCKQAPKECVKECPKDCKKECPCPTDCPKKECPCPTDCPKKECPCPTECCEVGVKKEAEPVATQTEARTEMKVEQTLSSTAAIETPAS